MAKKAKFDRGWVNFHAHFWINFFLPTDKPNRYRQDAAQLDGYARMFVANARVIIPWLGTKRAWP